MRTPRLTKSIFLDQFLFMQAVGVLIGVSFPYFLVWYGFPEAQVMHWDFFIVTQIAGQMVGLVSFLLISTVIRPHLKLLSHKMQEIADGLDNKSFLDQNARCEEGFCRIEVLSNDEIGVSAHAYNQLLQALIQAHEVERVYNRFSKVMSENLETDSLADRTLDLLIESTHIEAGAILVVQGGELELIASQGILNANNLTLHDVVVRTLKKGKSTHLILPNNIDLDGVLTEFKPSEVFIEPIEFKGVNLGVLVAATGAHPSDERTEQLIQLFSRSLGLALNNAMIHSKFQKLAAVDGLTNVYNRRFGMERLKEDFSRSVRDRSNLSLAMVDIDHFKKVNDTYGHLVGDKVIVLIAAIIKKALRDGDIVVRYGGEEFLLVLHGASCGDAEVVCERIRHQVNDTIFKDGDQQIDLTVSIGLVSYPEQMSGNEVELLDKADQALYHGKQTGRNKVVRYGALKAGAK